MPFDGQRMIMGGFTIINDLGAKGELARADLGYVDGVLLAVPASKRDAYDVAAANWAAIVMDHGATRFVDAWGDDLPDGKVTDFKGAVKAKGDETVVFSWTEWPSKQARDAAWPKVMADPRIPKEGDSVPFDGQRMVVGGFVPILDA
jgi:uncharacterized protein YbaA (DUF1428 family)